jgi:hypothetical protein
VPKRLVAYRIRCYPSSDVIADVRHARLYECVVRATQKKLKLNSDGCCFVNKKCNLFYGGSSGVCIWQESGVVRSVLCWRLCQKSGSSCREGIFTCNLFQKEV